MRERPWSPGDDWTPNERGLYLPPSTKARFDRPVAVDLFSGAGGFSCGFHQAGWHVVAALEFDTWAAMTYAVNLGQKGMKFHFDTPEREAKFDRDLRKHLNLKKSERKKAGTAKDIEAMMAGDGWISTYGGPGCEHFWIADAHNVTGAEILEAIGLERGEVDCVFGGPPCQGFSTAGRRDIMDPRNSLVFEFMRIVCEIQPKTFVMENVPGIVSMKTPEGIPVLEALAKIAESGGMGEWEAIRDMLAGTAGVGAAFKGTSGGRQSVKRARANAKSDRPDAQLSLEEALA